MKHTQNSIRLLVIGLVMACALNSRCAEYAGWAVGPGSSGSQDTILRSTDSGVSWTPQGIGQVANVPMFGVHAVDANTAWVVGLADSTGTTIYHTTDGGQTWNRMLSAAQVSNAGLQKVSTFGDSSIWAVGQGTILHSGDSGATWTNQLPAGYEDIVFQGISTPDGVNVWATGNSRDVDDYATVLKSSDGGLTWTRQSAAAIQLLAQILDVSSVNANTAWAIGSSIVGGMLGWTVIATTDGGVTWTSMSHGTGDGNGVCAVDASTIWVVTDNNTLWSSDGGAVWSETSSQTDTMGICAIDSQTAWAVSAAGYGAIQRTTDGGNSWAVQSDPSVPSLFAVSFAPIPPAPTVSVNATTPDAYEFGPIPGMFTFSQTGSSAMSIHYTLGGTANNGDRYSISGTTVSIPEGGSSVTLSVPPIPNDIYNGDQPVILTLVSDSGYVIGSGSTATVTIHDKPINAWQFNQFGSQANTASVSGDLVINNQAGITNLMAYALGINANTATVNALPTVGKSTNYLTISLTHNPSAIDITCAVQGSSDLISWSTLSTYSRGSWSPSSNVTDISGTATIQDTTPVNLATKRFLRLEITH